MKMNFSGFTFNYPVSALDYTYCNTVPTVVAKAVSIHGGSGILEEIWNHYWRSHGKWLTKLNCSEDRPHERVCTN